MRWASSGFGIRVHHDSKVGLGWASCGVGVRVHRDSEVDMFWAPRVVGGRVDHDREVEMCCVGVRVNEGSKVEMCWASSGVWGPCKSRFQRRNGLGLAQLCGPCDSRFQSQCVWPRSAFVSWYITIPRSQCSGHLSVVGLVVTYVPNVEMSWAFFCVGFAFGRLSVLVS